MINSPPILLAGLDEIIGVLVTAAFFVIWLINQINDAKKKQVAQVAQPQAVAPPPRPAPPIAAAGAPPPADPLRGQIDEFLRRAAQQKMPQQKLPQQAAPRPPGRDEVVVLIDEQRIAAPPRKTLADAMRSKDDATAARRDKPARERKAASPQRVARQQSPSVADHVAKRIGAATQEFREEVADLGQRVKQADEQFDVQLHQKFDHTVGRLGDRATAGPGDQQQSRQTTPAAQIAALLASPEGVRQAVLLNEILRRPTDRW
jgi:hypothetical protein